MISYPKPLSGQNAGPVAAAERLGCNKIALGHHRVFLSAILTFSLFCTRGSTNEMPVPLDVCDMPDVNPPMLILSFSFNVAKSVLLFDT